MGIGKYINGYVQANGGFYSFSPSVIVPDVGLAGGAKFEKDNSFVKATGYLGSSIGADISAGHEFPLSDKWGIESAINIEGRYDLRNSVSNQNLMTNSGASIDLDGISYELSDSPELEMKEFNYHNGYIKAGISGAATYKGNLAKVKLGAEVGFRETLGPKVPVAIVANTGKEEDAIKAEINFKQKGLYVTPVFEAEVSPFKDNKYSSIFVKGSLNDVRLGIRWTLPEKGTY